MKKLFTLIAVLAVGYSAMAQNLEIRDSLGTLVNDQTFVIPADGTESKVQYKFYSENVGMAPLDIKLRRVEMNVPAGTQNYFCWSICYNPLDVGVKPTWIDAGSIVMQPDTVYEDFRAYHKSNGETGPATYYYCLYDRDNPADSACLTVVFDVPLSTPDVNDPKAWVDVYPNPATGWTFIDYNFRNAGGNHTAVVYDMVGHVVMQERLNMQRGKLTLDTEDLPSGIYSVGLFENDRQLTTRKLVVQ